MIALAAVIALLAANGLAAYTLGELIAVGSGHSPGWWAFVLVALAGYALPRILEVVGARSRRSEAMVAGAGLLLVYAVLRIEFAGDLAIWGFGWVGGFVRGEQGESATVVRPAIAAVLLAAVWIRSTSRSANGIERERLPRELGPEFAVVTVLVIVSLAGDRSGAVGRGGAAFYAVAVIALACGQLSLSGASIDDREAGSILTALLAGTVAVVVAGLALVTLVLTIAGPIIGPPLGSALNAVLIVILWPFGWFVATLVHLFSGGHAEWPKPVLPSALTTGDPNQQGPVKPSPLAIWTAYLFRAVLFAAIVAGAYGAFRWAGRFRRRLRELDPGSPTDTASGRLRDDLTGAFRAVFRRQSGHDRVAAVSRAARLYLEVLAESERAGRRRAPAQTPAEFAPELAAAFQSPVTDEITRAFEQARYAGHDPSPEMVADLERRWRAVR